MHQIAATSCSVESDDQVPSSRGRLQPISGWPLAAFGAIEEAGPGFLWRAMHTRPGWRQAAFAALASGILKLPENFLSRAAGHQGNGTRTEQLVDVGAVLLRMRPREIIEAAFGECPDGFLGALDKIGFEPLAEGAYARLHSLFTPTDPESRRRMRCLEQMRLIDDHVLDAVEIIDSAILSPTILGRFSDRRSAIQLNEEIAVVRLMVSTANDNAIRASLEMDRHDRFPGWMGRWLQKCDQPIPKTLPVDGLGFLERVMPSSAKAIGEEFDNCLGRDPEGLLGFTMSGVFALLAWRHAGLLIEISMLDDGTWMTRRIHARSNGAVTKTMRLQVQAALEPFGVKVPIPATPPPEVGVVLREIGAWRTSFADVLNDE